MKMKTKVRFIVSSMAFMMLATFAGAQAVPTSVVLNVNNISTPVYVLGYLGFDGSNTNFFVDGSNRSTLYANGLWIGSGSHTAVRQFGSSGNDFYPGPLTIDGAFQSTSEMQTAYNRVWYVTRTMIDEHLAHFNDPGYMPAESILNWPANGTFENTAANLAPFYDVNGDGRYNALDGDYPLIRGDEAVFSIFNDAGTHGESGGEALGIEVHCMTYAFNAPQDMALHNTIFMHYDIFNRSTATYEATYIGMWSDFDIGNGADDYIGCDVSRGMYYGYNGQENDAPGIGSFGGVPPAQGCVILAGPWQQTDGLDNLACDDDNWSFTPGDTISNQAINGSGFGDGVVDNERIGMTNFMYYENSVGGVNGHPSEPIHYYNYLRSYWKNGVHAKFGGNGASYGNSNVDCSYMFPGDSDPWHWGTDGVVPEGFEEYDWTEASLGNASGDRRGVGACGPFVFMPSEQGSHQEFDVAYVTGWGTTVQQSVAELQNHASSIRSQFNNLTTNSGSPFIYQPFTVGMDGVRGQSLAKIYPNPASNVLSVSLPHNEAVDVQLFNMTGQLLMTKSISGTSTLDISSIPQGVYVVKVGALQTYRVVVLR